jgi:hypothetical protein
MGCPICGLAGRVDQVWPDGFCALATHASLSTEPLPAANGVFWTGGGLVDRIDGVRVIIYVLATQELEGLDKLLVGVALACGRMQCCGNPAR